MSLNSHVPETNPMRTKFAGLAIICAASFTLCQAQTVQNVRVAKSANYVQTNATTVILDPKGGAYGFGANVTGSDLSGITPPALTLPVGSTFNDPLNFAGQLAWDAESGEWRFGLVNANDWGATSQAVIDSLFANGIYRFTVLGTLVQLNLSGNAYPNVPVATLSGGTWLNGQYVINAGVPLTITTSSFTDYGRHADDIIHIHTDGTMAAISQHSSSPETSSLSYTVPSNSLAGGRTHFIQIAFTAVVSMDTSLPGSINFAGYSQWTGIQVVTLPHLTVESAGGKTVEFTFTGILQQSSDLKTWSDVTPQPASPFITPTLGASMFYRAKAQGN